ncbi:MAG: winged helix-turn-helix domain-containing protein, partial [Terriglobia bacterium]
MKKAQDQPQSVRFGPFEYDPVTGDLRRRGHQVRLVGQPRVLLGLLIDRADSVVTREEMRSRLWPEDTFVDFEHSLNSAIKKLRQALRDSAVQPQYIETIPRRGYRFVATVISSSEFPNGHPANALELAPPEAAVGRDAPPQPEFTAESNAFSNPGKTRPTPVQVKPRFASPAVIAAISVAVAAVVAVAVIVLSKASHSRAPAAMRLTLLVSGEGDVSDPAISPDGAMLAYVRLDKGIGHIYVRGLAGGNLLRLVKEADREAEPAFSPDGERIAFTKLPAGSTEPQICVVPALGGSPHCIINNARDPAWSPDGEHLAFVLEQRDGAEEVATARSDGAGLQVIMASDGTYPFLESPSWSADGRTIAFVRSMGGVSGEIWLAPAAGGAPKRFLEASPGVGLRHPVFTPDAKSLIYRSNQNGADDLWRADLGKAHRPVQVTSGPGVERWPSISRLGQVVFVESQSRNTLLVTRLQTGATQHLLRHSPHLWAPAFSPDGLEISVSEEEYDGRWRVWITSLSGADPHPITSGDEPDIYSRFSRNGKWITYFTWTPGGSRVWRVPRAGGRAEPLTPSGEDDAYGELSPDGRTLVFARTEHGATRLEL